MNRLGLGLLVGGLAATLLQGRAAVVYSNSFSDLVGTKYPEWASSIISFSRGGQTAETGRLPAPAVTNVESPNHRLRFLGLANLKVKTQD